MYPNDTAGGMPAAPAAAPVAAAPAGPTALSNGLMQVRTVKQLEDESRAKAAALNAQQHIGNLATHVKKRWTAAKTAKRDVEDRMLRNLRARNGQYDADKLAQIKQQGGSEIYMMLTATKVRGASALIRDAITGTGNDKPWSLTPTKIPDLPPERLEAIKAEITEQVAQLYMSGMQPTQQQLMDAAKVAKDMLRNEVNEAARESVRLMEDKMEDQLSEGGFLRALADFIDDFCTFPSAIMKGPVIRKKSTLAFENGEVKVVEALVKEWDRVDPLRAYPAPGATDINDGDFIEHHRLTPEALSQLMGVEGYNDEAIRTVLADHERGGLKEWLRIDSELNEINENTTSSISADGLIDALQFWGVVSGKLLIEWGMDQKLVKDGAKMYYCEVWLIGNQVIKAGLISHPLGHKPYYKSSYEKIPGKFWGNAPPDIIADCQDMCNAAARALANNMGIGSGPQVWVNLDRLPDGENIDQMYPWKIWQTTNDPTGSSATPMGFFQPETHAQELMAVYREYAMLADEYSGIPRYMTGAEGTPGAGRTASGLSMMITNAGKTIKQVITNIDLDIITPLLEQLYFHNMRFESDPDLKGDVKVAARGAMSLQVKDAAQIRRVEFLQSTANPIDMQIVGMRGRGAILREVAKTLDMNVDDIVPSPEMLAQMEVMAQQAQQMAQQEQALAQQQGNQQAKPGGEELMDGAPTTDNFSPS